uniref:Uncharacterized protein LOC117361652 n=1 Tax=Geotrypetes seraphini TaxID=260995 RepID=A0A6P8R554_GEOSA|nr:uncharacterized protein LOC117361652 [Geotrypetes seraphini]
MDIQVTKLIGHVTLVAAILFAFDVHTGICITDKRIHTAVQYVLNKYLNPHQIKGQHAYILKFTQEECNTLNDNVLEGVLEHDTATKVAKALQNGDVYEGTRMVIAKPKDNKNYMEHAEYRLLNPIKANQKSAVQKLLDKQPVNGCVIFYSLISPCVNKCLNTENRREIMRYMNVFDDIGNNYKVFVYKLIYNVVKQLQKEQVWNSWKKLNQKMPLYRCDLRDCFQCFPRGDYTVFDNNVCMKDF